MSEVKNESLSFNCHNKVELNASLSPDCHSRTELHPMYQLTLDEKEDRPPKVQCTCKASRVKPKRILKKKAESIKKLKIKKRTPTSYDSETSFYLKTMFFQIYSTQKKLTKTQRLEVQRKTGLNSRKVTYWFSNHKRRSKEALKIYHDTIRASGGQVSNYQEFIMWRRSKGLPEHVSGAEIAAFKLSKSQNEQNEQ